MNVRAQKCVFLHREKLFGPWASVRKGQECPQEIRIKEFMFIFLIFPGESPNPQNCRGECWEECQESKQPPSTDPLRGPAVILFISHDICSDSIAKLFRVCFNGVSRNYRAIRSKMGIAKMCLCTTKYQGGGIAPFWGSANFLSEISRDMGYRSDSIGISHDMVPLSCSQQSPPAVLFFPALFPALSLAPWGFLGFLSPVAGGPDSKQT